MTKEIERKFLVEQLPKDLLSSPFEIIEQGYLAISQEREVRIRRKGQAFMLTVKSNGNLIREEYETLISKAQFETLWPATVGKRLQKQRWTIPLNSHIVEVDAYHGNLEGVYVAEVEFKSAEAAILFVPPPWFKQEITHFSFMKNKNIFRIKSKEELWKLLEQ